ncbi:BamA/TamA family outer membrane protein [Dysgonomonas sp. OttesenSCG-928-M03]|nr:BamA/TamA family outer membrane protein [Dysgonomonas sp. OttesenSCG-928-M03]
MKNKICYILLFVSLWSCNTTKNIPEGKYLMNGYNIKSDTKQIDVTFFDDYVRQQPNNKIRLSIYNTAGQDTSKWLNRFIQKIGQKPVIYSAQQTQISAIQIARELSNQGYLRATVDTLLKATDKKMSITYNIKNNGIYKIRNYKYTIDNKDISRSLIPARKYTSIQSGVIFNQENLENSREHLTSYLRNIGYYNFSKEYFYFKADTTLNSHEADVYLSLYEPKDSTSFKKFKIRNVSILSGFDAMSRGNNRLFTNPDTVKYNGIDIIYGKNNFLRKSTLYRNNFIRRGRFYSDMAYTRTTGAFNGIGIVKQTNITFTPVGKNPNDSIQFLDAQITLAPGNTHFLQTELQGTNSAGDLGIAPSITYQHQNLFNGAEIFKLKLRGAYEFISGTKDNDLTGKSFYEYGIDASLAFPQFLFPWLKRKWREQASASTQISAGLNMQHRKEYTRQFFNAGLTYRWTSYRNRFSHTLSLLNINYVRMPWASNDFKTNYLSDSISTNAMVRESYKDQLIAGTTYGITYTNTSFRKSPKNQITIRGNIDISGWLPRLVTSFHEAPKDTLGQKQILGIAYAEYVKTDASFALTHRINRNNNVAFHIGLGVAVPFGNSNVLPFETRYFSGGANSLRGWSTRTLGPGSYSSSEENVNYVYKVGDIKLDMNVEYRRKVTDLFELAGFIDAGNVWTIKDYKEQPGGKFEFSDFYKEIALSYGLGLRLDLNFLLLRFDVGARAYDPAREKGKRWVTPNLSSDRIAWHFAIGYPF